MTSQEESITIDMPLSLQGRLGGTLHLNAATDLTFTPLAMPVSLKGGFEGGIFDLEGGRMVAFLGSSLQAAGLPLSGGSGGTFEVAGGTIDVEGDAELDARGATAGAGAGDCARSWAAVPMTAQSMTAAKVVRVMACRDSSC